MKRLILLVLFLCLVSTSALADPVPLLDDYAQEYVLQYDENDPSAGKCEYIYRYPHPDPAAPGAAPIDSFYAQKSNDSRDFSSLINADYYMMNRIPARIEISYVVTCNNDDYFSALFTISDMADGNESVSYDANVFSREEGKADSTYTLPQMLKILSYTEDDEWLQERQTAKADTLVRDMVWERMEENAEQIEYYDWVEKENLEDFFHPEEDFYLGEDSEPVFFMQPGAVADEKYGLITFRIPLDDILDEL